LTEKKTSSTNRVTESEELFSKLLKNLSETVEELPWRYSVAVGEYQGTFVEVIKPIKYGKQEAYKLMESIVLFLKSPSELESLIERNKKVDQFIQQSKARREKRLSNQQRKRIKRIKDRLHSGPSSSVDNGISSSYNIPAIEQHTAASTQEDS
jgi:hypothetical protein